MGVLGYAVLGYTDLGQSEALGELGEWLGVTAVRAHQQLWDTSKIAALNGFLLQAIEVVQGAVGRPGPVVTILERHLAADGDDYPLILSHVPCPCGICAPTATLTVTGITRDDGVATTPADWRINGGILYPKTAISGCVEYGVTYTTGYTAPPQWMRLAILRMVEHLWQQTQQAPHPAFGSGSSDEGSPSALSYLMPYQVESLIDPHKPLGV